jgi:acetyl esterase
LNELAINTDSAAGADLDPDIRRFIQSVSAGFARYPDFNTLPYAQMRQIAEAVRAPWTAGGPVMINTAEFSVPSAAGKVRVRVLNPSPGPRKPALIYLHGGGWTLFSIDTHDRLMREYGARADFVAIGVDYALSPEARFPTALNQVVSVVHWVRKNCEALGIDPDRVALGGDSAGGNLTMAACLKLRDAGEPDAVRAMVLNYAAFDNKCSEESHRRYGGAGYMLGSEEMVVFWNNYLRDERDGDNPLVCPIRAQLHGLPPAFLAIPECDVLAQQSVVMADKLRAAGVAVCAVVYRGASHSFLEAVSIAAISERALAETSRWLRATLKHS